MSAVVEMAEPTRFAGWYWIPRAILLGLLAFIIFGPLVNLVLWTVTEKWC